MAKHLVEAEELQAYLDGELTTRRHAEVETHLKKCRECSQLLQELKRVSATLQRWQVEPAPASLRPPAVESVSEKRSWWSRPMVLALAGTAAVALLAILLTVPDSAPLKSPKPVDVAKRTEPTPIEEVPPPAPAAAPPVSVNGRLRAQVKTEADRASRVRESRDENARRLPAGAAGGVLGGIPDDFAADQIEAYKAKGADAEKAEEGALRKDEKLTYALESSPEREPKQQAGLHARTRATAPAAGAFEAQNAVQETDALANRALAQKAGARPLVAYQVWLTLAVKEFEVAKNKLLEAVEASGGYVAQASTAETPNQPRRADLVLRIPIPAFNQLLEELRQLGRVVNEQQSNEEVTAQVIDLEARLRNARATEERLVAVLKERTGKVREILEVEQEIARKRQEIEQMEAQRQHLLDRVQMATLSVVLVEEFKAQLTPAPVGTGTRLRNALIEGVESFVSLLLGFVFFLARYGLNLAFWLGLVWLGWRGVRRPLLAWYGRGLGMKNA